MDALASMTVMNAPDPRRDRRVPHVLRLVLCLGLAFGIFAMHEMLTGTDDSGSNHRAAAMVDTASHAMAAAPSLVQLGDDMAPDPGGSGLAGCCGIVMICVSMLVGLGALLILRARGTGRILWQLPPPHRAGLALRIPQFCSLTPLQRSSVLRC